MLGQRYRRWAKIEQTLVERLNKLERVVGKRTRKQPSVILDHYFKTVCYDGYVKYKEAEILRSAIMQDFRDSEKKGRLAAILDF